MSRKQLTTDIILTGDMGNILKGLRLAAAGFAPGQYRDGFLAALGAVAASTGSADDDVLDANYVVIENAPCGMPALYNGSGDPRRVS